MSADDKTRILPQVTEAGVGTQLSGIYELDERIASGGMGEVYRGHNIQTDDLVAIKIVLTEFARDPTILSLFKKEASVLNHLAHDAIVRYHVFTVDPGIGRPYLAMEYVHGESLVDLMGKGPMSPEDAAKLCARLASGLSAAHEAGVIHRDLSPDNIILPGGRVDRAKIIDFGIARSAAVGGETLIGGKFAGKYNYVSPEQLGLFGGEVSEQSDIYSLGLVLAAALRAEPLDMSGSQVEIIEKRRTVPDLSTIDPSIRPVLAAMLQPDPAQRPRGMAAVAEMANAARTTLTQPPEVRPARENTVVGPRETTSPPWSDPQSPAPTAPPAAALPQASSITEPPQPERPADFVEHRRPAFLDAAPPAALAAASAPPPRRTGRMVAIAASLLVVAAGGAYLAGVFEPASAPTPQASNTPTPEPSVPAQPTPPAEPESTSAPASQPPAEDTAAATSDAAPAQAEADSAQADATPPAEPAPLPETAATPATEPEPSAQASPPAPQSAETAPTAVPTPAPETTPPVVTEAQPVRPAPEQLSAPEQPQATQAGPAPAATADKGQPRAAEQQVSRAEPTPPAQPEQKPAPADQPPAAEPQTPAAPEAAAPVEPPATPPAAPTETAAPAPRPVPQPEPTQPEPQVTAKLDNVAERISWLRSYTGGQCFYATTTSATDTATKIEGFGTTVEPFMQLLQSFQTRFNMEPDVGVRLIEPAQCVVADFLRDLPRSSTNPPELTLDRTTIPNGTPVSGRLAELEGRKTELILIDHKGMAFNLNSRLTMNGSRAAFSIPIGLSASDQAAKKVVPQVIIALTSPGGIRAAEFINPVPAKELLPKILDEIRATGSDGTATAKYFRLGG